MPHRTARPSRDPVTVALGLAVAVLFVGLAAYLAPLHPTIAELQLTFTRAAFHAIHDQWPALAQARFRAHFAADYLLVVLYAAWGHRIGTRARAGQRVTGILGTALTWLLPMAAVADVIEDVLHTRIVDGAPPAPVPDWLYPLAGTASVLKYLCVLGFFALLFVASKRRPAPH